MNVLSDIADLFIVAIIGVGIHAIGSFVACCILKLKNLILRKIGKGETNE